jgi:hypothetical protein
MLTFSGGGVKVTQLTRRVKLGNQLEIECRAEPGERAGLPVVLSLIFFLSFYSLRCLLFLFELTLHVFKLQANKTMGIITDGFRIRKIKFTFSRADRLSI